MKIEERREGPAVVVSPVGRLDADGTPEFEARISAVAQRGDGRLVLDCTRMTYISSGGVRAVLVGATICQQRGVRLSVAALGPECRLVLQMSGMLPYLDHHETLGAALAAPERAGDAGGRTQPAPDPGLGMEVEEHREPGNPAVVLSLSGRLIGAGTNTLEVRVNALVEHGEARVVLDCERVGYINSAGLRTLLVCARTCQREGGEVVLAALRPECRTVIQMSGFLSYIHDYETREGALAALA